MSRSRLLALAFLVSVTACEGFKEAMTAHVDVAAKAGSQELSVQHLAEMIGKSQVPLRKEVAQSVADVWVNYQLVGIAAANSDSLSDPKIVDEAMWPVYTQERTRKWYEKVSATFVTDTNNMEAKFNEGVLLSARHILFQVPAGQEATGSDSIKKKAEAVRARTTSANFAALAKQYGSDGTKDQGGDLGLFPKGAMVPEFENAIRALKPGEIGPLVKTQFGYHIIRRSTYDEVKDAFAKQYETVGRRATESTFVANVENRAKIEVKPTAAKLVKEVAANPDEHRTDRTVVATYAGGEMTAARLVKWIGGFPQPEQVRAQLQQAPDSVIPMFLKSVVRNELFLQQADSAKIELDTGEVNTIRRAFKALISNAWAGLGVAPSTLSDSAKTKDDRLRIAAARVDAYVERLVQQQERFVEIPAPLSTALHEKYDGKVNDAGLDRAVQAALKIRASADSARAASQPKSAVPIPETPGAPDTTKKKPAGQ
ncbi:MAG: peptidylprolyl isomerase [Gemmatimonadaceae bacterium]